MDGDSGRRRARAETADCRRPRRGEPEGHLAALTRRAVRSRARHHLPRGLPRRAGAADQEAPRRLKRKYRERLRRPRPRSGTKTTKATTLTNNQLVSLVSFVFLVSLVPERSRRP